MVLRVALIGCGFFAENHMQAWAGMDGAQVVAVCDRDPARAARFAARFGATPFTDAAAMLAEVRPDIADIATTVPAHRMLVELAARHAGAVICQKPLAETLADARAMVAACAAAGIPFFVHENFRWQLPYRALKQVRGPDGIGAPHFLRLSFRHGHDVYTNQPYLAEVRDLALTDIGLHLFDMARFLMGDIDRVACVTQRLNPRVAGQDAFQALLAHTGGAISTVECSFFSHMDPDPFPETLARIEGDRGTAELLAGMRLRLSRPGWSETRDVEPPVPAWGAKPWHLVQESVVAFQSHVVAVMQGHGAPQPSGAHNMETLAVTLAAIRAAATGQTVSVAAVLADPAA
jgi:predicted dehydrogenase